MLRVLGSDATVIRCTAVPSIVGLQGTVVLESMRTLTIAFGSKKVVLPKVGTALKLKGTNELVIGDEMKGRLEERLARGSAL